MTATPNRRRLAVGAPRVFSRNIARGGLLASLFGCLGGGLLSCSGDTVGPAPISTTQAFFAVHLTQHAVNLALTAAPGHPVIDTVQLTATALTAAGTPLPGAPPVHYSNADSSVTVSATGLVTAHFITPGSPTAVVASLTIQGVTLTDTAFIQVTQAPLPAPLASFSLQPAATDSTTRSADFGAFPWPVSAADTRGTLVCGVDGCPLRISYTSSNPDIAKIDPVSGQVTPVLPGHVVFTATTLAYGQAERATVAFTIGYLLNYEIFLYVANNGTLNFQGYPELEHHIHLGQGAVVSFVNLDRTPLDVVFTPQAGVDTASWFSNFIGAYCPPTSGGNIPAFEGDTATYFNNCTFGRARRFPVPDTYLYHYHSALVPSGTDTLIIGNLP